MTSQFDDSAPTALSWSPKITPYRVVFLVTTSGLGVSKAVLVSKGETASSTTVEWITGVVVALIFQFLGSYEYDDARPQYLDWIFCYNCLGRRIDLRLDHSDPPPLVTGYRLLVSALFAAFGLAKMFCGYLDLSTAMNTLDWIIAVPLTLGLYFMGLYEENKPSVSRRFFDEDYSPKTKQAFRIGLFLAVHIGGTVICIFWFKHWLGLLHIALTDNTAPSDPPLAWESLAWTALVERTEKWTTVTFYIILLEVGVVGQCVVLWSIIEAYSERHTTVTRGIFAIVGYVTAPTLLVTFCAFAFVLSLYFFLVQLSSAISVYKMCYRFRADSHLSLPLCIFVSFVGPFIVALTGSPVLILPGIFILLYNRLVYYYVGRALNALFPRA